MCRRYGLIQKERGYEFAPLYKSVPNAAMKDKELYAML
jgi:hypothetical protein